MTPEDNIMVSNFNVIRTEDENEDAYGSVDKSCTYVTLHNKLRRYNSVPHFAVLIYRILG